MEVADYFVYTLNFIYLKETGAHELSRDSCHHPAETHLVVAKAMAVSHPHEAWCCVAHCVQAASGGRISQLWHARRGTEKRRENQTEKGASIYRIACREGKR